MKFDRSPAILGLSACISVVACSGTDGEDASSSAEAFSTTVVTPFSTSPAAGHPAKPGTLFEKAAGIPFGNPAPARANATVLTFDETNPANARAKVNGFGAAFTDASAGLLYYDLPPNHWKDALTKLMDPKGGIGLNVVRVPIAASDSTYHATPYSYDGVDGDTSMKHFSIEHDKQYILPELAYVYSHLNRQVRIVASPWSAPGWMKSTHSMIQGDLDGRYYQAYASYIAALVQAYWDYSTRIPIYALTPQNEPDGKTPFVGNTPNYPGMAFSPQAEANFITKFLVPTLHGKPFPKPLVFGFDHNWGDAYPGDLLDDLQKEGGLDDLDGMAFHCYGGNGSPALTRLHDDRRMNGKEISLTECDRSVNDRDGSTRGYRSSAKGITAPAEGIEKLIYAFDNYSTTYLAWQLVTKPDGSPNQGGGCTGSDWHCIGVATVNGGKLDFEWDYAYLGHASKYVQRGAQTFHVGPFGVGSGPVEPIAFVNPDGTRVVLMFNASTSAETFELTWTKAGASPKAFTATIAPRTVATYVWQG